MAETSKLLTVGEVAARLQCHPHTVRRWIWDHKLRAVKVGDLVRVPEEAVDEFVRPGARRRVEPMQGSRALVSLLRKLRQDLDPDDVTAMERAIGESELPADWHNPLA